MIGCGKPIMATLDPTSCAAPKRESIGSVAWLRERESLTLVAVPGSCRLLLGREGREVLGIDNSNKVIEQAKEHLSNEAGPTQDRVSFVEATSSP